MKCASLLGRMAQTRWTIPFQQMIFWQAGFKQLSEDLSSSPSGRHLGHYKAALDDPELCIMYATVISIPFRHGIILHQWTSAVQVMLEKIKGCAQIDKLWVIQLVETDLYMALQIIFGCCLIHRAEDRGTIPFSQWGSRPNRSSIDAILLKRLSYDGLALLRQSAIIFNNDCKAAFNRMTPSVGGIALRHLVQAKMRCPHYYRPSSRWNIK